VSPITVRMPPVTDMVTRVPPMTGPQGEQRWVVAATQRLANARQVWAVQRKVRSDRLTGHVVVYGMSQVGRLAIDELLRLGQTVVAVERPDRQDSAAAEKGLAIIRCDLRQPSGMSAVGLSGAKALILTADDDMGNLQVALDAASRYPGLRVVVRMFRLELGRHIQRALPNILTLSNSRLAAPRFVGAALLDDWQQRVPLRGYEVVLEPGGTGRGGLALPGAEDDSAVALRPAPRASPVKPRRAWVGAASGVLRDLAADRRLHAVLALIVLLVAVSTVVFRAGTSLSWFAALYAAVTEVATTGLEPNIATSAGPIRAYAVVLLFAAAVLLAAVYALFTDALVSVRLSAALGRVPRRIRDHVVVCGLGAVGLRVAERVLDAGVEVVAVQLTEDPLLLSALRQGIPIVIGDARFPTTLREAQAQRARAVIVVTRDDLTNLETALMLRREFPNARVVVRMYDQQLARQARDLVPDVAVLRAAALAGPAFAAAALGPRVRGTLEHADRLYAVAEAIVQPTTAADGSSVGGVEAEGRLRVLGIERDTVVSWRPAADADIAAGDTVIALAAPGGLDDLVRLTRTGNGNADRERADREDEDVEAEMRRLVAGVGEPPTGGEPWIVEHELD
jgi:Trk K+ transport system NAD-binding subunit